MNKKSFAILNLMAFSSLICLSAPVMAATAKSGATPALQISDAPWSPPGPPVETASAAQTPALEISDEIWQPQQSPAAPTKTPVSEKSAVPPPALYVPGTAPVESQPLPQKQPLAPVQQAKVDVQLEKPGTISEPPAQTAEDLPKIQAEQSRIDSLATQNAELEEKLKSAGAPSGVASVTPPADAVKAQASIAPAAPPADTVKAQASIAAAAPPANTQVLKTLQDQIDRLAKDNAELQQKLTTASATPAPASGHSAVVASSDSSSKARITKETEPMHVVKFDMKDDDAGLPALAPASGGPVDSIAPLPGKDDPAPVAAEDSAPVKASLKDEQPLQSKAQSAPGGTWQAESVEVSEPAQASEIGKLKKRYEMSEAENAKLGDMVKVVKDQCDQEKGQMEKMLFDPKISEEQQRAYISDLEHQLGESQQALAEQKRMYDLQIRLLKSHLAKHSDS